VEPTDDEAHRKTETEDKLEPVSKSPEVGIPNFWLTALKNNALIKIYWMHSTIYCLL
jgi:hypothetical protein